MRGLDTSERPVVFIWELTQACELSCEHCRADAQSHRHPVDLYHTSELFERLRDRDQLEGKCGACPFVPEEYDGPLPDQELPTPGD